MLFCFESVLLSCSNSPSWPSRSRCLVSVGTHTSVSTQYLPCNTCVSVCIVLCCCHGQRLPNMMQLEVQAVWIWQHKESLLVAHAGCTHLCEAIALAAAHEAATTFGVLGTALPPANLACAGPCWTQSSAGSSAVGMHGSGLQSPPARVGQLVHLLARKPVELFQCTASFHSTR